MSKQVINYNGKVSIELYNKKSKYKSMSFHNEGKKPLFYFLAQCINGEFNQLNLPKYLQICNGTEVVEGETVDRWVDTYLPISDKYSFSGTNEYNSKLSFVCPGVLIGDGNAITKLRLHSENTKNVVGSCLAEVVVEDTIEIQNAQDYTAYISWTLTFKDGGIVESEGE